jgi:hypothetical protein
MGRGHTQAHSIDLVVGRGGIKPDSTKNVDPNFKLDAARIYISQKADIDDYFGIATRVPSIGRSAIGLKADAVRIVGTEGISLVTRINNTNSRNGFATYNGVDIIAGNDISDLQKMVKGDNLIECITELEERLTSLYSLVLNFVNFQVKVNTALSSHTHTVISSPVGGGLAAPSVNLGAVITPTLADAVQVALDNFKERVNLNINFHNRYLNSASTKYICSKYNKVN